MYTRTRLTALVSLLLAGVAPLQAADMQPGLWEITSEMQMQGMGMRMPATTQRTCISREDMIPMDRQQVENCTMTSQETSGDTVEWTMECNQDGMQSQGHGRITYSGDHYQGTMEIQMDVPQMGRQVMTQKLSGKRVGDCPK